MGHLLRGYKIEPGGKYVMHKLFDSDAIPAGWFDSPEKCLAASRVVEEQPPISEAANPDLPKRKRGRPKRAA